MKKAGAKTWAAAAVLVVVVLAPGAARGEAWLQAPGDLYLKVSGSYFETREEYDFEGDSQELFEEDGTRSDTRYRELALRVYAEYGVASWLTLVGQAPLKNVRSWETITPLAGADPQEALRTNYGLGDLRLAGRVPLWRGPVAVAAQAGVKLPMGYDPTPWNEGPALGTGEVDGDFRVAVGRGLPGGWMEGSVGYRVRGGQLGDERFLTLEGGWRPQSRWYVKLRYEGLRNVNDPIDLGGIIIETPAPPGLLNQVVLGDQDFDLLGGEVNFALRPEWSVSGEVYHLLAGKNTLAGTTFQLSLVYTP